MFWDALENEEKMTKTKEERLQALQRQRKASGKSTTGRSGSSGGGEGRRNGTSGRDQARSNSRYSSNSKGSAMARTPEELRQKRRKEEWERKVREARMRRMIFMLAVLVIVAVIIVVAVKNGKDDSKVFHESPNQTEEQTQEQTPEQTEEQTEVQTPEETEPQTPEETEEESEGSNQLAGIEWNRPKQNLKAIQEKLPEYIQQMFLPINEWSRPCIALGEVEYIVIHYVGNANTSAKANWDYFHGLSVPSNNVNGKKASSNFIVGLEGEVIQCMPLNEMAYCSNHYNPFSISIEVCHPDESGQFNSKTYMETVKLTAWLCKELGLTEKDVIRHYDVTGKKCPMYYVNNPEAWDQFREDVAYQLRNMD